MRQLVEDLGQVAAEIGVPGVAMDQVSALDVLGHAEIDRNRPQGRPFPVLGQRVPGLVGACHQGVVARGAPKQ